VLYTSGSTGRPKGVMLSHANAFTFLDWCRGTLGPSGDDRFASHAPFHFDLSVFDLFASCREAATLVVIGESLGKDPAQLGAFLAERRISVWYSAPSILSLLIRQGGLDRPGFPAPRLVLFAGEVFPIDPLRRLRRQWPEAALWNLYGPTETNVCTAHEVTEADLALDRPLPIGRACSGDAAALAPDDTADEGELVVTGPTVMLGYWGREPQRGAYRTGDLVRRDPDGLLHYVGRSDQMEKVRGHRIEPGEIETALGAHPDIADACVVVVGSGLDAALHAIVVPNGDRRPSLLEVKRHCAERLPTYMIVDRLHTVTELPRTPNGKVDRRGLAAAAAAGGPK
jgi:clorobiocin biosynthesis protein CloN4